MSIDLYWDDDAETVMLCEFNGNWTWDELHKVLATIKRLSLERGRIFGAIVDVRQGLSLPNGSVFNREGLEQFRKLTQLGSGGKGPVVILGVNTMIRSLLDVARSLDKSAAKDIYFADTETEARRTIYRMMHQVSASA